VNRKPETVKRSFNQFMVDGLRSRLFRGECRKDYIRQLSLVENGNSSGGNTVLERLSTLVTPFLTAGWSECL